MKRLNMLLVVVIISISNVYAQDGDTESFEMSVCWSIFEND